MAFNRREHVRLMWLLSQLKAEPPKSRLLWDKKDDYVGWDPDTKAGHDLRDEDLVGRNMLYIADTYGVYTDDFDALPRPIAHLELSKKIYGGLTDGEMDVIERFAQGGGRIVLEFNSFATPTPQTARRRMEDVLAVRWSGWAGRRVDDFGDDREIAQWVQKRWAEETGKPFDLVGPGIRMIHEDGRVLCLQEQVDIPENPMVLAAGDERIPYTYWFDVVAADVPSHVRGEFWLKATPQGQRLLKRFGVPTRFPAIIHDDELRRVYPGLFTRLRRESSVSEANRGRARSSAARRTSGAP
jgi:hypothetical protein